MTDGEQKPLCFVLMPFNIKTDASGRAINFDVVYSELFKPAIDAAGMEPLRADEERDGGIIHKPMFERLVLCPFGLADLTLANANVFYELGVRHAVRPYTTVLVFERGGQRLPFDVAPLRAIPYDVDAAGKPTNVPELVKLLTDRLQAARDPAPDSPLYQLLEGFVPPDLARLKTDVFRDRVRYSTDAKRRLAEARTKGREAVLALQHELEPLADQEAGVLVDLYLSLRDVEGWEEMLALGDRMPSPLRNSVLVREQRAFALNRLGRRDEAQRILEELIEQQGPSSETYGLLGRVHKDRWHEATSAGRTAEASAHLRRAIAAYKAGFEADWRDAFPGINALTLLEIQKSGQPDFQQLLPVVRYAVERRLVSPGSDYWDHASMLGLAVLGGDAETAEREAGECLAFNPPAWQRETTTRNIRLLYEAKLARGEDVQLIEQILKLLA
ncbi:MAG: DUF4071 domain-containing protein [Actinomycetota bacterium]|nr:DUF4071 domain-containing protein [Actinomycetota bacterium]